MKIGFVIPWFAMDIPGGAEAELRGLALHLHASGMDLEILTTCVEKFGSDWNKDYYPEGLSVERGIPIRRFPVRRRNTLAFNKVNRKLMMNQIPITDTEEMTFIRESVNSPALYRYMKEHKAEYDLFVFIPYMFGTTWYGMQICPEKSVLIPCLHEESYAHLRIFAEQFSQIAGMTFLSKPEADLASALYDLTTVDARVLGAGVDDVTDVQPQRFREKYRIDSPFLLYAGRKDAGKNVDDLIRYFSEYRKRHNTAYKLILIGGGQIGIPAEDQGAILDLGFVPVQDKYDACGAADLLCQPSSHESFSIVIMESWLANRPVLVSGHCEVTKNFVKESNGGLYFENFHEFEGALAYMEQHPETASQMGLNGCAYVREHFMWDKIVDAYTSYFEELIHGKE